MEKDKVYSPNEQIGEYTILNMLGEGRYGICYLVSKDGTNYIIKQLKNEMLKKYATKIIYEQEILMKINHERIPKFISKIQIDNFTGYILEYKEGVTFEQLIYKNNYVFTRKEIYDISNQLIQIVKYLHDKKIIHRDIRVPNTIYNKGNVYLIDFGVSRWIDNDKYKESIDFSYIADFVLHLYYTSYDDSKHVGKGKTWDEELELFENEELFLKKLFGMEEVYKDIYEVEKGLKELYINLLVDIII